MSNNNEPLKPGDLAWLMNPRGPWPVCEIERFAMCNVEVVVKFTDGTFSKPHVCHSNGFWCKFREPYRWGMRNGVPVYSDYFPVDIRWLKKITGPDTLTEEDMNAGTDAPVELNKEKSNEHKEPSLS